MARTKGTFNISANIETNASAPLDARERVATLADLTASGSFPYFYEGMQVYVVSEHKRYTLKGNDPTVSANWEENGAGGSDNVVEGYFNPADDLFYEEDTYTTPITGAANTIYISIDTDKSYRFDGTIFVRLDHEDGQIVQIDTLPTASSSNAGKIYQFVGTTNADYVNGYFYKCIEDTSTTPSTYSWANVEVQNGTVSMELTQQEYDNLTDEQKSDGTVYYITDGIPFNPNSAVCGFTPVGTVISVMGNSAPRNYLACNGQVVDILDYPELANYFEEQFGQINKFGGDGVTTFGIPDLRGEFLRGTGTNSHTNQGSGANVGTHQDATEHIEVLRTGTGTGNIQLNSQSSTYVQETKVDSVLPRTYYVQAAATNASTATSGNGGYTSRPTNTSVLYCIAVRDIYIDARYDYSTDEKVVGTWIDGKPLYQKIFETQAYQTTQALVANAWTDMTTTDIPINISQTIKCRLLSQNGAELSAVSASLKNSVGIRYFSSGTFGYTKLYIIAQYTKTTD